MKRFGPNADTTRFHAMAGICVGTALVRRVFSTGQDDSKTSAVGERL